jgi:flagellar biosynthesis component FlhA
MELSDLPNELAERGIWWQIGGFAVISAASAALLVEFEGSGTRAYHYLEVAVKTLYWANVFVLIGLFEGVRKMFEKASTLRARYRKQAEERAEKRATERVTKQVTERVTQQVTERVTKQVTERVTQQVTERVTQQVTERVTKQVTEQIEERQRARRQEVLARFGVEVDGVRMLPDTPEVQRFLDGEDG